MSAGDELTNKQGRQSGGTLTLASDGFLRHSQALLISSAPAQSSVLMYSRLPRPRLVRLDIFAIEAGSYLALAFKSTYKF